MDTNQNIGSLLNDFSGSSPTGRQASDDGDTLGSVLNGYQRASQSTQPIQPRQASAPTSAAQSDAKPAANVDEFVRSVAPTARRVAQQLGVPVDAVIGQWGLETGWGKSVVPGTNNLGNIKDMSGRGVAATDNMTGSRDRYRQYGTVDEFADDFTALLGNRRYSGVPGARDAQAYFGGLKSAGYAEDPDYVRKGVSAAQMAAAALGGVAASSSSPAEKRAPPKWSDITAKPQFAALTPEKQAEAKATYFDHYIAPRAGQDAPQLRERFMALGKLAEPGVMDKIGDGMNAVRDAMTGIGSQMFDRNGSVLDRPGVPSAADLPTTSKAPVERKVRLQAEADYDKATPELRQAMMQQPGWRGQLARERAGVFERLDQGMQGMPAAAALNKLDPRIEARRQRYPVASPSAPAAGMGNAAIEAATGAVGAVADTTRNLTAGVLKIGPTALKGVADVGNMLTADSVDMGVSKSMQSGMEAIDNTVGTAKFNQQQKGFEALMADDTQSIGDMFGYLLDNPSILVDNSITTIGSMFLPAAAAKGAVVAAGMRGASAAATTKAAVAASIGTSAAQNAADTFSALEKQSLSARYQGAAISAGVSILMGVATGGGAEGQIAKKLAGDLQTGRVGLSVVKEFLKSVGKEATQEAGEEFGNAAGEAVGSSTAMNPLATGKRAAFAGTLGGLMGGGTHALTSIEESPERQIAREIENGVKGTQFTGVDEAARTALDPQGLDARLVNPDQTVRQASDFGPAPSLKPAVAEITPDGRIDVHPTVQAADDIVRELATAAGISHETVLPNTAVATEPIAPTAIDSVAQGAEQSGNTGELPGAQDFTDQDVIDFAEGRFQQLRAKSEGTLETQMTDQGPVDSEVPGAGLSAQEQQEFNALQQTQGNPAALRQLYGFDETTAGAAPLEQAAVVKESLTTQEQASTTEDSSVVELEPAAPLPQGQFANAEEAKAYISQQRRSAGVSLPPALPLAFADGSFGVVTKGQEGWDGALALNQASKPKTEKQARAQRAQLQEPAHGNQAPQTVQTEAQGQETSAAATEQVVPPRTEKEARSAQKSFVKVKTFGMGSIHVKQSDLDAERVQLPIYTADGQRKGGTIHRENLDPTGEKQAASNAENADNPFFRIITRKDGTAFPSQMAARRELNKQALGATHEVVPAAELQPSAKGYVLRKRNVVKNSKHPPTDIRPGDTLRFEGQDYTVTGPVDGGLSAERVISEQGGVAETETRFIYGDEAIGAKIEADQRKAEKLVTKTSVIAQPATETVAPASDDPLKASINAAYVKALGGKPVEGGVAKTAEKLHRALVDHDAAALADILNPSNKTSRAAFEIIMPQVKLANSIAGLKAFTDDLIGQIKVKSGQAAIKSVAPGIEEKDVQQRLAKLKAVFDKLRQYAGMAEGVAPMSWSDDKLTSLIREKGLDAADKTIAGFESVYLRRKNTQDVADKMATAKPRTEKEANQQRDHSAKWFGTQAKADAYLAKNSITGTHEVVQAGKKFEIRVKTGKPATTVENTTLLPSAGNFAMAEKYKTEDTRSSIEQFESGRESIKSMDDVRKALEQQPSLPPSLSSQLQEAHKASGRDVKRSVVLRSLNMEKADQTGTPKAKRERAEIISRLEADLALFDKLPTTTDLNAMFDDVLGEELAKDAAKKAPPKTEKQAKGQRTAAQAAASAAKNTAAGLGDAIDGLGKLFGGNGRLSSGLTFDEDTYAKAKPLFVQAISHLGEAGSDMKEAMRTVIRMVLDKFGAQAANNMKPFVVRFIEENSISAQKTSVEEPSDQAQNTAIPKEPKDVPSTDQRVERDSPKSAAQPAVGDAVPAELRRTGGTTAETGGRSHRGEGSGQHDGAGVPFGSAPVDRERSDQRVYRGNGQPELASITTGADFGERGSDVGIRGVPPDALSAKQVRGAASDGAAVAKGLKTQRAAAAVVKSGDLQNIRETLPFLLPHQQEDVKVAEDRFAKPTGYGMLFTNGTGTGKTFTGLGIIKRFALQGKTNTLIVVPDEKIQSDWVASGQRLGLTITPLASTKDEGKGIVITTYANLGANDALATRQWDLVTADEVHTLMQAADGAPTGYLHNLRAITHHPDGALTRFTMLNRKAIERQKDLSDWLTEAKKAGDKSAAEQLGIKDAEAELASLSKQLVALQQKEKDAVAAMQGSARPRLVGLSATPFAYEKTLDWANGYLFDYKDGYPHNENSTVYNQPDPREHFFQTRFGYSMRYNKLTEPNGAKIDRGLLQRQFNGELKKSGSLSGRMLDVAPDYDRRFVLVDSAIGNRIDEALAWLTEQQSNAAEGDSGFGALSKAVSDKFKYLEKRYLLEAIKATEVIPIVKAHMAMGRKVVVFHDYKKGGGFNPFDVPLAHTGDNNTPDNIAAVKEFNVALTAFNAKFGELVNAPLGSMDSPIEVFKRELPGVLLINGDEKKADLLKRYKAFQDDATGPQVMLVQSAKNKGWSGHDTTGKHQRVLINLGQPTAPTLAIQQEGRIYRTGQATDAIMRYLNTGTNWERWTFASTIASRASTAENLGMGEMARALKDSFIQSFEESDAYPPGHEGEGKGGKERDKAANNALTEFDRAKTHYWATQKKNSRTKAQEGADYFATPEPVGLKMVEWLDARSGEDLLEPSGGHGAIARWLPEKTNKTVIEPSLALRSRLALVMNVAEDRIIDGTFEGHAIVNKYDGIVMNPPFGTAGRTAIDHLAKAAQHLRDGGRIVALIPTGPAADAKFDKWLHEKAERAVKPLGKVMLDGVETLIYKGDTVESRATWAPTGVVVGWREGAPLVRAAGAFAGSSSMVSGQAIKTVEPTGKRTEPYSPAADLHLSASIKLPQVTFERAGTAVATRIVVIEKQSDPKNAPASGLQNRDLSGITDIGKLFDRLENMDMPARPKAVEVEPIKTPKAAKKKKPVKAQLQSAVGDTVTIMGKPYTVSTYTTNGGKDLLGVWVPTKAIALFHGPSTFEKKGLGFFVRERDFPQAENETPKFNRKDQGHNSQDEEGQKNDDNTGKTGTGGVRVHGGHPGAGQELATTVGGKPASQGWAGATRISRAGSPVTVFRGASQALEAGHFEPAALGKASGNPSSGLGAWFTTGRGEAASYGKAEAFQLDIRNPKKLRFDELPSFDSIAEATKFRELLRAQSYDGIILSGKRIGKTELHVVAFDANQVIVPEAEAPKFNRGDYTDGHDHGTPDNSPDTLRAIQAIERRLEEPYSTEHPIQGWHNARIDAVSPIAQAFGTTVVGYQVGGDQKANDPRDVGGSNGFHFLGYTFLNASTDRPHLAVLGHETAHEMRRKRPDLYNRLVEGIRPYIKAKGYGEKFAKSKVALGSVREDATPEQRADSIREEFVGEVLSDGFMDPVFWQALGAKNKQLLAQVQMFVGRILDRVFKTVVGYNKRTEQYLTDYQRVMQIAGEIMAEYGMDQGRVNQAASVEVKLNRKEDSQETGADPTHAGTARTVQNNLVQFFGNRDKSLKTFGLYDKTLSTQFNKALKDKHYGKVFGLVNAMQNEVSLTSIRPAELAPGVLPRVDDVKSALKQMVKGKKADGNISKAAHAIFSGTLDGGSVLSGRVWTGVELRGKFGLDDTGVALYQQSRAAIDASLDEVAAAEAYAMAQGFIPKTMRRAIIDDPRQAEGVIAGELQKQIKMLDVAIRAAKKQGADQQAEDLKDSKTTYLTTLRQVEKIFITGKNLKIAGYAPLMRFGAFTVTVQQIDGQTGHVVRDDQGESVTEFYGQFETQGEARTVENEMRAKYAGQDDMRVTIGTKSQSSHELYAGISPETLALFAEAVGATEATNKFYQLALTERSALKRRLERKGTSGFNQDLPRVLSTFITSNGRFAAQRYYLRDLNNAIKFIPKEKGDVLDEAVALKKFVMDPKDTGAVGSSMMFAWFLGGSVASALVNLTQPVMMTAPYLSQFGIGVAATSMAKALPYAMGKKEITDIELRNALKRASQEGIVDAQEIFHLYSVGAQGVATGLVNTLARIPGIGSKVKASGESARARITAFGTLWGSMFSLAEGFNRKLTFIAAWNVALTNKEPSPYAFAVRAVNETQGIYNKVNRPNWARSTVGRTILTFKQFSLMYVEMLHRMWARGGPEGKRAALIMLATLMLAAGEEGLPFAQDLDDLIDTVGQMFGLDTNMRRGKRRLAHHILGKSLGDLFLYGVSSKLPLDFSGRLGLGNLVPGTGMLKPSNETGRVREVSEVFGPAAGLATQMADAYDAATEGNWGKAAQNMAPTAVRNAAASVEMAKKGYATDTKGRKVTETTGVDAAFKGIGFNPTAVAQEHRKTMPLQQDIALQKKTEASIVEQWSQGAADNDQAMMAKAQKRMEDWNKANPDTLIQISAQQIRSRVRQMLTDKDARLMKSAPREMRSRMGLDLVR